MRAHLSGLDQPDDAGGQYTSLATSRAGQDQRRLVRQRDCLELLRIEAGEDVAGDHVI
jgi:hypothetical protein